ncbi:MAG: hypothetical protein HQK52_22520 [Oligoflexia bacterium]|nr:hypothetical protein [Oligoflexia bacterium]
MKLSRLILSTVVLSLLVTSCKKDAPNNSDHAIAPADTTTAESPEALAPQPNVEPALVVASTETVIIPATPAAESATTLPPEVVDNLKKAPSQVPEKIYINGQWYDKATSPFQKDTSIGQGLSWKKVNGKWVPSTEIPNEDSQEIRYIGQGSDASAGQTTEWMRVDGKWYIKSESPFQKDTSVGEGLVWKKNSQGKWIPEKALENSDEQEIRISGSSTDVSVGIGLEWIRVDGKWYVQSTAPFQKDTSVGEKLLWKKVNGKWVTTQEFTNEDTQPIKYVGYSTDLTTGEATQEWVRINNKWYLQAEAPFQKDASIGEGYVWKKVDNKWVAIDEKIAQ